MIKIPRNVYKEVKDAIYGKADEHGYMSKDRVENGIFMQNLVSDPDVGMRLSEFMPSESLKTYIKDTILNRYAKEKTASKRPRDVSKYILKAFGCEGNEIDYEKKNHVSLHKLGVSSYVVVARCTLLKWETGLRKAIEYVEKCPGLPTVGGKKLRLLLVIGTRGPLTKPDKVHIKKSLAVLEVESLFVDEI